MCALLVAVALTLLFCSCEPLTGPETELPPEIPSASNLKPALDEALRAGQGNHDLGLSAAIAAPGHKILLAATGNSASGVPVTTEMVFDAGSVVKNFEAALALGLAEQDRLNLDDPISTWLPPLVNVDRGITVRQLLSHTSGLFNVFEHPSFPWVGQEIEFGRRWRLDEVFRTFVLEPYGPPGRTQHYSSTNYLLLTAILEAVGGEPVTLQLERQFVEPLKLGDTSFSMGEGLPPGFSAARGWADMDGDGELEDMTAIPLNWIASLTHPVIYTTPYDLVRWLQAVYYERTVLSASALEEMLTYAEPAVPDPEGQRYGLGVVDYTDMLGMPAFGHGGSAIGYSAAALYLPEYGVSVAWLLNTGEGPPELAGGIMGNTWKALSQFVRQNVNKVPYRSSW